MGATEPVRYQLEGDIDLETAPKVLEELVALAERTTGDLVLDCSHMHFIDSTGLRALEAVKRKTGRTIVLEHVQPACRRVLEITHLDHLFEVRDDDAS